MHQNEEINHRGRKETQRKISANLTALRTGLLAFLSVALLASVARAYPPVGFTGSPKVALDKTRHDFGEVFIGETLSYVFQVQNVGTAPLNLAERELLTSERSTVSLVSMWRAAPS